MHHLGALANLCVTLLSSWRRTKEAIKGRFQVTRRSFSVHVFGEPLFGEPLFQLPFVSFSPHQSLRNLPGEVPEVGGDRVR